MNAVGERPPGPEEVPDFGAVVRFHRKRAGLSQADLARLAGTGKTVVFDVEKGKPTVRLETLVKLLCALNIRLTWDSPLRAEFRQSGAGRS